MSTTSLPELYTAGPLARRFGVETWHIIAAIRRKYLTAPRKVGHYRVWTADDLPRVRAALIAAGYLREEVPA